MISCGIATGAGKVKPNSISFSINVKLPIQSDCAQLGIICEGLSGSPGKVGPMTPPPPPPPPPSTPLIGVISLTTLKLVTRRLFSKPNSIRLSIFLPFFLITLNCLETTTLGAVVYPEPESVITISTTIPPCTITSALAPPPCLFSGIKCSTGVLSYPLIAPASLFHVTFVTFHLY